MDPELEKFNLVTALHNVPDHIQFEERIFGVWVGATDKQKEIAEKTTGRFGKNHIQTSAHCTAMVVEYLRVGLGFDVTYKLEQRATPHYPPPH
ncbi:hypothetical protein AOL_s00193g185 [Orbilia oligospora ATCC 24927]|uniref:Uncharacterized protein n=1 Tax=Arthrobotrys oligospora (strain ATCC 24927 / CBS 115.81 / DSM 1491) TaxID=756982 RepID=G1XRI6_ARTOA|nr:hypothetical protein AOL_s00193g185 [Orbilia oligospora ATCC 24927]EGX44273.1 hypothetical protein AOL_s00193g185 [Orbilia oligospora ATCC 24927]